jgi:hypothetical protein
MFWIVLALNGKVTLAAAAAAASDIGGAFAEDGKLDACPRMAGADEDEPPAVPGLMGVELALFAGAMLAGDGSMGGVD